jgi:hypothetical protein
LTRTQRTATRLEIRHRITVVSTGVGSLAFGERALRTKKINQVDRLDYVEKQIPRRLCGKIR